MVSSVGHVKDFAGRPYLHDRNNELLQGEQASANQGVLMTCVRHQKVEETKEQKVFTYRTLSSSVQVDSYTIYLTQHLPRIGFTDSRTFSPTNMFVAPHLLGLSIAKCP